MCAGFFLHRELQGGHHCQISCHLTGLQTGSELVAYVIVFESAVCTRVWCMTMNKSVKDPQGRSALKPIILEKNKMRGNTRHVERRDRRKHCGKNAAFPQLFSMRPSALLWQPVSRIAPEVENISTFWLLLNN